jgi:hypothetical protein
VPDPEVRAFTDAALDAGITPQEIADAEVVDLTERVTASRVPEPVARLFAWADLNAYEKPEEVVRFVQRAVRGAGLVAVNPAEVTELRRKLKAANDKIDDLKVRLQHEHARAEGYY